MTDKKDIVRHVEEALYTPSCVEAFRGNRLIEAMPDFLESSASEMQGDLASTPGAPPLGRSRLVRAMWLIDSTPNLFVAEGRHIKLFEQLDMMIRHGYSCRAPDSPEHLKYLSEAYRRQQSGEHVNVKYGPPSYAPITTAVIGCSGTGKSMAVEQVLRLYPQLIHHPETESSEPFYQLVHLKTECPPDGSVKSLCKNILTQVDWITGLDYSGIHRVQYATEADLRKAVTQTLALHRTGILVIDEMQNLTLSRKNREELFNFVVSLANSLRVPLVNVGTPKVRDFMAHDMRIARRFGTWGVNNWSPLKATDAEWGSFYDEIRKLYVLDEPMQAKAVEKALFTYSQGIAGILVNLFAISQMQAMVLKEKKLTPRRIKATFDLYFSHVKPIVDAIRTGDEVALAKYQDLGFTDDDFTEATNQLVGELKKDGGD